MRPALHHTAPEGWINDPYGLVTHDGTHHLFFQHVPGSVAWDVACRWGHATSTDLLHWTWDTDVLVPDDTEDGCWSGSVVVTDTGPVAFYTSVAAPRIDLGRVRSVDLATGRRSEVLVEAPPGATHFRDPFVWRDGDRWRMLLGAATADAAAAWTWSSPDLVAWTPEGTETRAPEEEPFTGRGWECPQRLVVDGHEVLLVSVWEPTELHHVAYRLQGRWHRLTHGPSHYAASATHVEGRPGLVTWLRGVTGDGWAGATSLPMTLAVRGDRLVARPTEALLARRSLADGLAVAADVEWAPTAGDTLAADGFALTAGAGAVHVRTGADEAVLPWAGEVLRLVLDGPVLELYGDLGVLAAPVRRTAPGPLTWSGTQPLVHALAV